MRTIDPWQPRTIMVSIATEDDRTAVLANYVGKAREVTTVAQDVGAMWPTVWRVLDECPRVGKIKQVLIYTNDEEFITVYTPPIQLGLDRDACPVNRYHWEIGRCLFMIPRWRLTKVPFEKMTNTVRLFQ